MNCPNCNNKCEKCGCNDAPLTTPNYVLPQCANAETCSEILDAKCVVYTGSPISSGGNVIVNTDTTMAEALHNVVYNSVLPYKSYVANILINPDTPGLEISPNIYYNNTGGSVNWTQGVNCSSFVATLTPGNPSAILVPFVSLTEYNVLTHNYKVYAYAISPSVVVVDVFNPDVTCPAFGIMGFNIEIREYFQ